MQLSETIISDLGNDQNQTTVVVDYNDGEVTVESVTTCHIKRKNVTEGNRPSFILSPTVDITAFLEHKGLMDALIDSIDWDLMAYELRNERRQRVEH